MRGCNPHRFCAQEGPAKRKPDVRRCDLWLSLVMRRTVLAPGSRLRFGPPSSAEDASRARESVLLTEAESVRLQRRADELAARIARRAGGAVYGSRGS